MVITFDLTSETKAKITKLASDKNITVEDYIKLIIAGELELPKEETEKIVVTILE